MASAPEGPADQNTPLAETGDTAPRPRRLRWIVVAALALFAIAAALGLWAGSRPDFERMGPMQEPRRGFPVTIQEGWGGVVIAGGEGSDGGALSTWEVFDLKAKGFVKSGRLLRPRRNHVGLLMDDWKVLLAGGDDGKDYISECEIIDPKSGTVTPGPRLRFPRSGAVSDGGIIAGGAREECGVEWRGKTGEMEYMSAPGATLRGAVLMQLSTWRFFYAGGRRPDGTVSADAWIIDVEKKAVRSVGPMRQARYDACVTKLEQGPVMIVGGIGAGGTALDTTETFDEAEGVFSDGPRLLWPVSSGGILPWRYFMDLHSFGGTAAQFDRIVIGGSPGRPARYTQLLRAPYTRFERGPKLAVPRYGARTRALLMSMGEMFGVAVFGGSTADGRATAECEFINPFREEQGTWFQRLWWRLRDWLP